MTEAFPNWLPSGLLDHMCNAVLVTDAQLDPSGPRILYANAAWERMSGHEFAEVRGRALSALEQESVAGPHGISQEWLRQCLDTGHGVAGNALASPWRVEPIRDQKGAIAAFGFVQSAGHMDGDSSSADALDVMRELQHLLDHREPDLDTARQQVARAAMHLSGADAAVVEEPDGDQMVYRAVTGVAAGFEELHLPINGSASGYCYTARESLLIRDTLTDDRIQLGHPAVDIGFRSGILVPLFHGDFGFGVLKVFSRTRDAFGRRERNFLEILAGPLVAILYRARSYEIESQRRRHLVDALPMLVAYVDSNRRYREVNAAYADWFGRPVSGILGRPVREIVGEPAYEKIRPYVDRALEDGETVNYEETVTFPNDRPMVVSVDYSPEVRSDGAVTGFYALVRDITKIRAADLDYLTELPNRRRFEEEGLRQLEVSRRHDRPLSLIFADVDHFKWWNDTWGHQIGDRILKTIASQLRREARATDLVARWAGEEFAILAPETDLDGAATLAERIRRRIAAESQPEGRPVTLSFGAAQVQHETSTLRSLIRAADEALYEAKKRGRNRVGLAQ